MRAPRMRVGVYGDSRMSSLPDLLSQVGHDVSYMDYDPTPPAFEELDMVVLEVRDPLLEPAIERLAERARRGQIFIHTSLQHGVQVMDPLEVTGAVVIAMGELSPTRWAVFSSAKEKNSLFTPCFHMLFVLLFVVARHTS